MVGCPMCSLHSLCHPALNGKSLSILNIDGLRTEVRIWHFFSGEAPRTPSLAFSATWLHPLATVVNCLLPHSNPPHSTHRSSRQGRYKTTRCPTGTRCAAGDRQTEGVTRSQQNWRKGERREGAAQKLSQSLLQVCLVVISTFWSAWTSKLANVDKKTKP